MRTRVDSRLGYLASLTAPELRELHANEVASLEDVERAFLRAQALLSSNADRDEVVRLQDELESAHDRLFVPQTAGVYYRTPRGVRTSQAWFSVILVSEAGRADLSALGAHVRCRSGDVYTAFVPRSKLKALLRSPIVQWIELARPLFPDLDLAVPFAHIDGFHALAAPVKGKGQIVGVIDLGLDIYHPAFRKNDATHSSRVLFLWDQTLTPEGAEQGPPDDGSLPGFIPTGGAVAGQTYGVEYDGRAISNELSAAVPYGIVRHIPVAQSHGTAVTGCAAGNGHDDAYSVTAYVGAAPEADIIFVHPLTVDGSVLMPDSGSVLDAFAYIFARADALSPPRSCVVNLSDSDDQGPHDGTTPGETFLDDLLSVPGHAITLSAGNSTLQPFHVQGTAVSGSDLVLEFSYNPVAGVPPGQNDAVEVWYDGLDNFEATLVVPAPSAATPAVATTTIGPLAVGGPDAAVALAGGVTVVLSHQLYPPNEDKRVSVLILDVPGNGVPVGTWNLTLRPVGTLLNGSYWGWIDRGNHGYSAWIGAPEHTTLTLGVPSTAIGPITVGAHQRAALGATPAIVPESGRGPSRDGRIKPELAAMGHLIRAPNARPRSDAAAMALTPYNTLTAFSGTSYSAPLVAGTCALYFEHCGMGLTCADLKQLLLDNIGTGTLAPLPDNGFGFGFLQAKPACTPTVKPVDVWVRDAVGDKGSEPFVGEVAWECPDIQIFDASGAPIANPVHDPGKLFTTIVRVTVRNRGTSRAVNTMVHLYWADPGTSLPFPAEWSSLGVLTGPANAPSTGNLLVVPEIAAGGHATAEFLWSPPPPGSNLSGDDHFCLLVRIENASDPSQIGAGGWASITTRNNLGLRNIHVEPLVAASSGMWFSVRDSRRGRKERDPDDLEVWMEGLKGQLVLALPVQALPFRNAEVVEAAGGRLPRFGEPGSERHPLARGRDWDIGPDLVEALTDARGASAASLREGTVLISGRAGRRLSLRGLRLAPQAEMPTHVAVREASLTANRGFVRVLQRSAGRVTGGVTLEIRPA